MTKFKGTKGEWELLEFYDDFYCVESEDGIVCTTEEKDETAKADARLIAEAPKLLEALQKLAGIEVWISDPEMKKHFQETLYPAINKALGQ